MGFHIITIKSGTCKMKELIEAYLKDTEHYLSESKILDVECDGINNDDVTYLVTLEEPCSWNGVEQLHVGNARLLEFMWSKIK